MFLESAPQGDNKEKPWKRILSITISLLFWVVLSAIGLWIIFDLRALIVELMILAQLSPWQVRGYDRLFIFVLGLAWFVGMMWLEPYLRSGINKGRLWRNIGRVAVAEALLVAAIYGIRFVIYLVN